MRSKAYSALVLMRYSWPRDAPASCSRPVTCRLRSSRGVIVGFRSQAFEDQPFRDENHRLWTFEPGETLEHRAHAVHGILRLLPDFVDHLGGVLLDFTFAALR